MNAKLQQQQERINGPEAEKFLDFYYGKYFSGDITLIEDGQELTFTLLDGKVVGAIEGIRPTGIDVGVSGGKAEWDKFCTHRSLSVATNKGNDLNLTTLGGAIRFRQNWSAIAQFCRVWAGIRNGEKES